MMRVLVLGVSLLFLSSSVEAQTDTDRRLQRASQVFSEIMAAPDRGIPRDLLERAHCVVIVPGMLKGAFVVGAQYGKGFAFCRSSRGIGWSNPAAVRMEGGSVGFQIGGQETDIIMLVMNPRGMDRLMTSRFTIGGDASAAAVPVGRTTQAQTDAMMTAELLTWSRSRGLFAGISLNGATLRPAEQDNKDLYGRELNTRQVLTTRLPTPESARPLLAQLSRFSFTTSGPTEADRQIQQQQ